MAKEKLGLSYVVITKGYEINFYYCLLRTQLKIWQYKGKLFHLNLLPIRNF